MICYHATSKDNYSKILKEGILFGYRGKCSRCTYYAMSKDDCLAYGEVILTIDIEENDFLYSNSNYCSDCWQFRLYEPIDSNRIVKVEYLKN